LTFLLWKPIPRRFFWFFSLCFLGRVAAGEPENKNMMTTTDAPLPLFVGGARVEFVQKRRRRVFDNGPPSLCTERDVRKIYDHAKNRRRIIDGRRDHRPCGVFRGGSEGESETRVFLRAVVVRFFLFF